MDPPPCASGERLRLKSTNSQSLDQRWGAGHDHLRRNEQSGRHGQAGTSAMWPPLLAFLVGRSATSAVAHRSTLRIPKLRRSVHETGDYAGPARRDVQNAGRETQRRRLRGPTADVRRIRCPGFERFTLADETL
jgi:hypothetical protein